MIRVASIWNKRPDLGTVQVQIVRKLADSDVEFVVGTMAEGELLGHLREMSVRHNFVLIQLQELEYRANMVEMVQYLDADCDPELITFFVEEDIVPTKRFGWEGRPRASAYQGKSLRMWKGEHPELDFNWELIPHHRVYNRKELPVYLRRSIKELYVEQVGEEPNREGHYMEVFDESWLHYDKAGYPRKGKVSATKDALWAEICDVYNLIPPDKWLGQKEVERDPAELAAHHAHADQIFRQRGFRGGSQAHLSVV